MEFVENLIMSNNLNLTVRNRLSGFALQRHQCSLFCSRVRTARVGPEP